MIIAIAVAGVGALFAVILYDFLFVPGWDDDYWGDY